MLSLPIKRWLHTLLGMDEFLAHLERLEASIQALQTPPPTPKALRLLAETSPQPTPTSADPAKPVYDTHLGSN